MKFSHDVFMMWWWNVAK